jgi:DNA-binding NtrC family response regulator
MTIENNFCVLFVDDEIDICNKLALSFELEDFKVFTAHSGNQAIEVLRNNLDINFIISDVRMPDGDGLFLLEYVKKNKANIPIVMLSGFAESSEDELKEKGAIALISKPTNIDQLIDFVRNKIKLPY